MYLPLCLTCQAGEGDLLLYLIAALILIIRSVMTVAVVGEELSIMSRFPFYEAFRIMRVGDFGENRIVFLCPGICMRLAALLFLLSRIGSGNTKIAQLENYRAIILPWIAFD